MGQQLNQFVVCRFRLIRHPADDVVEVVPRVDVVVAAGGQQRADDRHVVPAGIGVGDGLADERALAVLDALGLHPHLHGLHDGLGQLVHYCNRKSTARLQPLQRVFHRMLTKNT